MTQDDTRGPWLVPLLAAFAAATAGLAAGWYLHGTNGAMSTLARPIEVQAAAGVTHEELASLKRELLARLDELARVRAPNSSTPGGEEMTEVGRRIDDLDARIALLGSSAVKPTRGPAWATARGPGSGSIESMRERIAPWGKGDNQYDALMREHQLWTMEDVMQAYGPPARVLDYNDAWTLAYGPFRQEGEELPCMIEFRFREGLVWEINFDCSGRYR